MNYEDDYGGQPNVMPMFPTGVPMNMPSEKADLLDKIRPDDIVETIRHRLMGEEFVKGRWIKIPHIANRSLTFKGAWDISNLMLSASSRNVSISKLKDDDIRKRTTSIVETAMLMCLRNYKEYGITGSDQIHFVREIVHTNSFVTLKQPDEGSIQKLLGTTTSEVRSVSSEEQRGGGFFSRMFRK